MVATQPPANSPVAGGAPIQQQPSNGSGAVMVQAPSGGSQVYNMIPRNLPQTGEWETPFCAWCHSGNTELCCTAYWATPVLLGENYEALQMGDQGEGCMKGWLAGPGLGVALRRRMRALFGLRGDDCSSCCCYCWCLVPITVRDTLEIRKRLARGEGFDLVPAAGGVAAPPPAQSMDKI